MKGRIVGYLVALAAACGSLLGCDQQKTTEAITEATSGTVALDSTETLPVSRTPGVYSPIAFKLKDNSQFFLPRLKTTADSALKIAAAVYNSQEFKDSLASYSFRCKSFGRRCAQQCDDCENGRFNIQTVFDSLYRQANVGLTLQLEQNGSGFGSTSADSYLISSNYTGVFDDHTMPFCYHYAVHICHEYMHNVGYFHFVKPKRRVAKDDVAEEVGLIAYNILRRWSAAGIKPF